jgi:hypothetical protein
MDFSKFDIVTEPKNGYPMICWEKSSEGIKYDYETAYEVIGSSLGGRTFKGTCTFSFGEVSQDPFTDEIIEVCSKCLKEKPINQFTMCTDCLDFMSDNDGKGNF